jgi:2-(3-amino-3-carboxypropyl)histidine synthase
MKILHIPAKAKVAINLSKIKLKGKTGILTTAQHLDKVKAIKKENFTFLGQVLGCNANNAKGDYDQYLYIGSGKFHPIRIALETNKPVYIYNPFTKQFKQIDNKEIIKIKKRIKGSYLKYLNAKKIGIITTTKSQNFKSNFNFKNKKVYYFMCNNITNQIENFPDIEVWVNTACPRLAYEGEFNAPIINMEDLNPTKTL